MAGSPNFQIDPIKQRGNSMTMNNSKYAINTLHSKNNTQLTNESDKYSMSNSLRGPSSTIGRAGEHIMGGGPLISSKNFNNNKGKKL